LLSISVEIGTRQGDAEESGQRKKWRAKCWKGVRMFFIAWHPKSSPKNLRRRWGKRLLGNATIKPSGRKGGGDEHETCSDWGERRRNT